MGSHRVRERPSTCGWHAQPIRAAVFSMAEELLCTLSLLGSSPALSFEIWDLMREMPWPQRYAARVMLQALSLSLSVSLSRVRSPYFDPDMRYTRCSVSAKAHIRFCASCGTGRSTLRSKCVLCDCFAFAAESYVHCSQALKRVSKESFKIAGRLLAKVAHASPLSVADVVLDQIEVCVTCACAALRARAEPLRRCMTT